MKQNSRITDGSPSPLFGAVCGLRRVKGETGFLTQRMQGVVSRIRKAFVSGEYPLSQIKRIKRITVLNITEIKIKITAQGRRYHCVLCGKKAKNEYPTQ
jgi:hypothetical protein